MLYSIVLLFCISWVVLYHLCCIVMYCFVLCCVLSLVLLYCVVLYCIVALRQLCCVTCVVLYCIVFHCTALHCIAMYCTVLYCIVSDYQELFLVGVYQDGNISSCYLGHPNKLFHFPSPERPTVFSKCHLKKT